MQPFLEIIKNQSPQSSFRCLDIIHNQKNTHFHYHPEIEMLYVIKGYGSSLIGDHVGEFRTGDLIILGENLPHDFNSDIAVESAMTVVQFNPSLTKSFPEMSLINELVEKTKFGMTYTDISDEIRDKLINFTKADSASQFIDLLYILNYLTQSNSSKVISSISFTEQQIGKHNYERLNNVIDYINNNLSRRIELTEIAEHSCMTPPSFCRWFKKSMNISFINYVNKCRIEATCRALLNTKKSISEIANGCGFESFSNFNRTFSKHKGMSPREYRNKVNF